MAEIQEGYIANALSETSINEVEDVDLDTYYSNRLADVEFCRSINSSSFQNTTEETYYEVVTSGSCNTIEFDESYSISGGYLYPLQGLCSKCKQISATWDGWSDGDFEKRLRVEIGGKIRFQCTTTPQSGWYSTSNQSVKLVITNTSGGFSSLTDSNVVGSATITLDGFIDAFTPSAPTIVVPFTTTIEIPFPDDSTASSFSGAIWVWGNELRIINLRDSIGDTIESGTAETDFDMYSSSYRVSVSKYSESHTYVSNEIVTYSQVLEDGNFVVADENKYVPNRCVQERHLLGLNQRSAIKVSSWNNELTEEQKTNLYGNAALRDSYRFSVNLLENPEYSDPSILSSAMVYTGVDDVGNYSLGGVSDSYSTDSYYDVDIYIYIPQATYTFPDKYVDTREIIFPIKINGESHSITWSQTSSLKNMTVNGDYQSSLPIKTISLRIPVPGVRTNAGSTRRYALYDVQFETPLVTMKYSYNGGN